jgi:hypothetical protein
MFGPDSANVHRGRRDRERSVRLDVSPTRIVESERNRRSLSKKRQTNSRQELTPEPRARTSVMELLEQVADQGLSVSREVGKEQERKPGESSGRHAGLSFSCGTTVSRRHARITVTGGKGIVEDLGSQNGTWVNEHKVTKPTPLEDGDRIRLGLALVTYRSVRAALTTEQIPVE